jgi:hypothetical protein
MKIGILGNMNNMYFSLARYLADEGYDCGLLVFDSEPDHFHPSADTFETEFHFAIKQLSWGDPAHFLKNRKQAAEDLAAYDFLIGNGTAPAFVHAIGRTLDIFIPYGDDLYALPFGPIVHPLRQIQYWAMAWHQRKGIRSCPYILFDKTNAEFDSVFRRLNYRGQRIISPPPLFYSKEYEEVLARQEPANPHIAALQKLRAENDLLVLQHIRQVWKAHRDRWSMKGNDHLVKGYAQFIAANPGVKTKLILLEYGADVHHTKKLIDALQLNDWVVWFPKTLRKHLMTFIQFSDVVVGELHYSWNTYCVVLETLAMGKPLIHKRYDAYLADAYPELYPVLHGACADTVTKGLQTVYHDKKASLEMGRKGKEWFRKYCVERPLQEIKRVIAEKQTQRHV